MFACAIAHAQYPQVRNFSVTDYQAGTQNWSIIEGPNQRMFIGNNHGLLVFDSKDWELHYVNNYSVVRALFFDEPMKRIYAGASNEFGYFKADSIHMTITYHTLTHLLPKDRQNIGEIWQIMKHGDNIVFQSKEELLVYLPKEQRINIFRDKQRLECAALINEKVIVAGSECAGILTTNGIIPLKGTEAIGGKVVRSILPYGSMMLFVTSNDGILAYNGQQMVPFELPITHYLRTNQVFCAAIDGDNLAFGTVRGGMVLYDMKNNHTSYANIDSWLQNNTVLSLCFDHNHNLWLGLDNGLSYVIKETPYSGLISSYSHIGTGYAAMINGQQLYLGTSQGLFSTPYPIHASPTPPQPQLLTGMTGQVWSLNNIDGTLFCGSDNGSYIIRGMTVEHIAGTEGTWNFAPTPHSKGLVIGCDYKGFFVLERQGNTYRMKHRIKNFDIISGEFFVDNDGSLWISHWQKGIFHVQLSQDLTSATRIEHFHKDNGLIMDEGNLLCRIDGKIYVSCVDGLYRYDPKTQKLVFDQQKSKFFDTYGTALRIFQTPYKDLWAYKQNYLALATHQKNGKFHLDSLSFRNATQTLHIGQELCYIDSTHTLVGANEGFYVLNNQYKDRSKAATTYIRKITGTNQNDTLLYRNLVPANKKVLVRIPHNQNSIQIEFIQTEYRDNKVVSYQCMLEGYDKNWSMPQKSTSKAYTNLPKGTYTFHVRAQNALSGLTTECSIQIEILPAWYETWWAWILYLVFAALLAYLIIHYLKMRSERELIKVRIEKERQLKEQQQQFSLEQAERERELIKLRAEQLEYDMKANASKLADSTMNLMRKNDMLLSLDTQMNDLSESVRREDAKANITRKIKDIRRGIQQNINDDENWEKFEENFNLVYDNYMRKLTARFPDLKLNDRKLCAYLRMGLSSKEMASLLNSSTRSIETARYRLRKKLQMESGENLKDFIQGLDKEDEK